MSSVPEDHPSDSSTSDPTRVVTDPSASTEGDIIVHANRSPLFRTAYLGFSFSILFTGFSVAQGFMTTLHPDDGFYSLATVYLLFALSSLAAPSLVRYFGIRGGMFVAACTYALFIFAENSSSTTLLLLISFINGCGAGLLWNYQGVWLKLAADEQGKDAIGYLTGVFFTINNFCGVTGNGLAWIVLVSGYSASAMIWFMGAVSIVGALLISRAHHVKGEEQVKQDRTALSERARVMWSVAKQSRTVLLFPYMFTQGAGVAFSVGNFPQMFDMEDASVTIAQAFFVYSISCVFAAYLCGKLFDRFGWAPLVFGHVAQVFTTFFLLSVFAANHTADISTRLFSFMLCGFLLGSIDNFSNSITNMSIIKLFPDATAPAFGVYRFFFSIGFTVQACLSTALPYEAMMTFYGVCTVVAMVCYVILGLRVIPKIQQTQATSLPLGPSPRTPEADDHHIQFDSLRQT